MLDSLLASLLPRSPTASRLRYTVATDRWTSKIAAPTTVVMGLMRSRENHAAVGHGDNLYHLGGGPLPFHTSSTSIVEQYSNANDHWTSAASMPTSREYLVAGP